MSMKQGICFRLHARRLWGIAGLSLHTPATAFTVNPAKEAQAGHPL
jgi:hypothetical protein